MASSSVNIKQETLDYVDIEATIIQLCKGSGKGITDHVIQGALEGVSAQQRVTAINRLLSTVSEFLLSILYYLFTIDI